MGDEFRAKAEGVRIEQGDANAFLKQRCRQTDCKEHRAIVFLDPYGMHVD